jgi:hypothetical protein
MKGILWLATAVLVGSYICLSVADPDLWWHITIGKWILAHQTVPSVDLWNMYSADSLWRAYSWTVEILFALVDGWSGAKGLLLLQLAFAIVLALVLQRVFSVLAQDGFVGVLIGVYTTVACFNHFTLRPQVIVWMLFALAIMVADDSRERRFSSKHLVYLGLIGVAWANTHLTAVLGLIAIFLWSLQSSRGGALQWGASLKGSAAFFLGTLITPYIGGEWLTFVSKGAHPLKFQSISEFQPSTILQYSTVFVLLFVVLLVVAAFQARIRPTIARTALAGGMTLAGLTAVKFLPFAAISLGALIAVWWRHNSAEQVSSGGNNLAEGIWQAKKGFEGLSWQTLGSIAFFFACISTVNIAALLRRPLDTTLVPKDAVDFIEEKKLEHPILNEFGAGGYLMYRYSNPDGTPQHKVAIDGRTNVNGPEIWDLYQASLRGTSGWHNFIDKVQPKTILWRQGSAFVSLLLLDPDWCRVFATGSGENDFVLFIPRDDFRKRRSELSSIDCNELQ